MNKIIVTVGDKTIEKNIKGNTAEEISCHLIELFHDSKNDYTCDQFVVSQTESGWTAKLLRTSQEVLTHIKTQTLLTKEICWCDLDLCHKLVQWAEARRVGIKTAYSSHSDERFDCFHLLLQLPLSVTATKDPLIEGFITQMNRLNLDLDVFLSSGLKGRQCMINIHNHEFVVAGYSDLKALLTGGKRAVYSGTIFELKDKDDWIRLLDGTPVSSLSGRLKNWKLCSMCKTPTMKVCSFCKRVSYCSVFCQRKDSTKHPCHSSVRQLD